MMMMMMMMMMIMMLCSLSMISISCFTRDSAADNSHPAGHDYETLDTQRQREEPQYAVVELDTQRQREYADVALGHIETRRPNNAFHHSDGYEIPVVA